MMRFKGINIDILNEKNLYIASTICHLFSPKMAGVARSRAKSKFLMTL